MHNIPAAAGWSWFKGGFSLFRKQPAELSTMFLSYLFLMLAVGFIPLAGQILPLLLVPVFSITFMQACVQVEQGKRVYPNLLFSAFRSPALRRLLLLGVLYLIAVVGAVAASSYMKLETATRVIPLGIAMGVLVICMNFIDTIWLAVPFLIVLGALGGFLVVPMNALLQHRGHNLMGAGRSIAVQNFNEQACILALGAFYSLSTGMGLSPFAAITAFGSVVAVCMWLIMRWHQSNCIKHKEEIDHLLVIARHDNLHG